MKCRVWSVVFVFVCSYVCLGVVGRLQLVMRGCGKAWEQFFIIYYIIIITIPPYIALGYTTLYQTTIYNTTMYYNILQYTTIHYNTLQYTTIHYTNYTTLITPQLQLQLHYTNCTILTTTIPL